MTREELIVTLSERFYDNFADTVARRVATAEELAMLYALITTEAESLPRAVRHKVSFRGAYVLERIFFDAPERFEPHVEAFCTRDFAACRDASAQRHFAKIMSFVLRNHAPDLTALESIADSAAEWAVEPRTKAAVRIWAMEVLGCCRGHVEWVAESWEDLLEAMAQNTQPSITCRLRRSWRGR